MQPYSVGKCSLTLLQAGVPLYQNLLRAGVVGEIMGTTSGNLTAAPSSLATIPHALLPLQAYDIVAPTINDDLEETTRTSLQLKAREHAASLALRHVRNTF